MKIPLFKSENIINAAYSVPEEYIPFVYSITVKHFFSGEPNTDNLYPSLLQEQVSKYTLEKVKHVCSSESNRIINFRQL